MKENPDMDKYASNERIEELLNSFMDGELTAKQQTEVEQLIAHDAKIAQRLRQLQKCKILVGSLPCAEAPAELLEDITTSLAGGKSFGEQAPTFDERAATKYLLIRKVLAAAAMIGLAAVLAVVIHSIVAPRSIPEGPVAMSSVIASPGFSGRLELKTTALVAVDAFINRAIEDNGLSDSISPAVRQDRRIYPLSCTREGLNLLLADLGDIWTELDSATLFVDTEVFGRQVVVDAVTTEQIAEIVDQEGSDRRIELAKDFAALNNIAEHLPGREILSAMEGGNRNLISQLRVPKPLLTTGERKTISKPTDQMENKETVRLTIIVDW
ncbi:MAG: anti-sigma factor family protein [Planctomycetota bacterium]|jgi:hypothetical protein